MPFWSTNFGTDATLNDPKRKFRFMVSFGNLDADPGIDLWYASTVSKPGFTINAAEHKYLNHTFYYPGNVSWAAVSMTVVDPVSPDVTATLSDILETGGYAVPANVSELGTISKAKATNALGTVKIVQLDAYGKELETWTLWNAFITDVKFGDMSYGDDTLQEVTLELRYDWAQVLVTNKSAMIGGKDANNDYFKTTTTD
jgi:hypothetical protein